MVSTPCEEGGRKDKERSREGKERACWGVGERKERTDQPISFVITTPTARAIHNARDLNKFLTLLAGTLVFR